MLQIPDTLTNDFSKPTRQVTYPYVFIPSGQYGDELPIVIDSLDKGNSPLVIASQNQSVAVADIAFDPINLSRLLELYHIVLHLSDTERYPVYNSFELLEVPVWTQ